MAQENFINGPARVPPGAIAMVSGSSSGIGRAIALTLAEQGFDIILHGRSHSESLAETVQLVEAAGRRSWTLTGDFSQFTSDDFEDFVRQARILAGDALLGWVNNAGVDVLTGPLASKDFSEKLDLVYQVDVRSTLMLTRSFAKTLPADSEASVVNIGWDQADTGLPGESGQMFAVSKGAIMAMTASLAQSYAPNLRVNCVAPGWIKTDWGQSADPEWDELVSSQCLLQQWGQPADIAATVSFLLSPSSRYINGQVLKVNGGLKTTHSRLDQRLGGK